MAPTSAVQQVLLSPAELSYLHTSLSQTPPIRSDSRSTTEFRPLVAESNILPGTNGSARICFADGTEAIVGVKAEVQKSAKTFYRGTDVSRTEIDMQVDANDDEEEDENDRKDAEGREGSNEWVELTVEIPGQRDDDMLPVFVSSMLSEALLADGEFTRRLWINRRFHWKLYIDILLLSPPLSYPLPLLSLTTHLALLSTRLPSLKSEKDEDPLFDDDWDASVYLYPRNKATNSTTGVKAQVRPPITLLVISVGPNIIFDPTAEELAVAETVLAVSVSEAPAQPSTKSNSNAEAVTDAMDVDEALAPKRSLRLLAVRTVDPPSRLTPPGIPNFLNTATGGSAEAAKVGQGEESTEGVWKAKRGGASRSVVKDIVRLVLQPGGVTEEIMEALEGVDVG